ncbi:MAG: flagellar protein FlaI [Patescibacteria group bacterium]|jgi:flagellar protein FlaI
MLFTEGTPLYSYEIIREGSESVLYVNYLGAPFTPSLITSGDVMARTIAILSEDSTISRIVFVQQRNYSYDFSTVKHLLELSGLYDFLIKNEKVNSSEELQRLGQYYEDAFSFFNYVLAELLRSDPVRAYRDLKAKLYEQKAALEHGSSNLDYVRYIEKVIGYFDAVDFFHQAKGQFDRFAIGDRGIYAEFFREDVMPNFTFTRMISKIPEDAEILSEYTIAKGYDASRVTIYKRPGKTRAVYHLSPPEYNLNEDFHMLLNLARNVLIEHKPTKEEFNDAERTRQVFFNIARDLIGDLASSRGVNIEYEDLYMLATVLVRHTIGFGVLEVLLEDEELQDIVVNAPVSLTNIFVRHNEFEMCVSNVVPSIEDADSWAAKFRVSSGRPLDEANPILDTNLELPNASARIAIIQQPLSEGGLAFALRRHRDKPWTLPLFMKNKMINGLGAGLLSFMIDGARTMLVAGTRSSGKTSLLGSLLLEIMPNHRVITVEDTLELPIPAMRRLGYDVLSMKVRSALATGESNEVGASEGIRTSLRLGDSALIVGEIRSEEAKSLYEAMRVGALANVVAGTIHGGSPYAVYDRVVNDLGVPVTSFKATDLIVVANPVRSSDGLHSRRRVLSITEVRKHWEKDPEREGGFVDLMKYDVESDDLLPTDDLMNGESDIIKSIASNVKGWAGDWDAVWDNIILRQQIKEELVKVSDSMNLPEILEGDFVVASNNVFAEVSNEVSRDVGLPVSTEVFPKWREWLIREAKKLSS